MSFLSGLGGLGAAASAAAPNIAAQGLGHLIGVDPSRVASLASSIGKGMNQVAAAGGAGSEAPPLAPQNHLQLLDPAVLQALIQRFGGGGGIGVGGGAVHPVSY